MAWYLWKRQSTRGQLAAIFVSPTAGAPMASVPSVEAVRDTGLRGDRYAASRGFWKVNEACQVTLISQHDLDQARGRAPALAPVLESGAHRRNLLIAGLRSRDLLGQRLRIGEVELLVTRPRPPCGYLEQVEGRGLATALGKHSGVCATVQVGGTLQVGDTVAVLGP